MPGRSLLVFIGIVYDSLELVASSGLGDREIRNKHNVLVPPDDCQSRFPTINHRPRKSAYRRHPSLWYANFFLHIKVIIPNIPTAPTATHLPLAPLCILFLLVA